LNIEVNDDDDGGPRDAKYSWIGQKATILPGAILLLLVPLRCRVEIDLEGLQVAVCGDGGIEPACVSARSCF